MTDEDEDEAMLRDAYGDDPAKREGMRRMIEQGYYRGRPSRFPEVEDAPKPDRDAGLKEGE